LVNLCRRLGTPEDSPIVADGVDPHNTIPAFVHTTHNILLRLFIKVRIYGERRAGQWKPTEFQVNSSPPVASSTLYVSK